MAEEADGSGFKAGAASFQLCSLGPGAPFPSASVSSRVKWGGGHSSTSRAGLSELIEKHLRSTYSARGAVLGGGHLAASTTQSSTSRSLYSRGAWQVPGKQTKKKKKIISVSPTSKKES